MSNIVWFEIAISDPEISLPFYQHVFGWKLRPFNDAPEASRQLLWHIYPDDEVPIGGIYFDTTKAGKNAVEIYIHVDSVDDLIEKAKTHGQIDLATTKRPDGAGYYARINDPDGNVIGVWSLN